MPPSRCTGSTLPRPGMHGNEVASRWRVNFPRPFFAAREAASGPLPARACGTACLQLAKADIASAAHPLVSLLRLRWLAGTSGAFHSVARNSIQRRSRPCAAACSFMRTFCGFAVQPFMAALAFMIAGDHHVALFAVFSLLVESVPASSVAAVPAAAPAVAHQPGGA
jgi:hypothetical protein